MYEQVSHALLNDILDRLAPEICRADLRHFFTRLGANFYGIHTLFAHLYGQRDDAAQRLGAWPIPMCANRSRASARCHPDP